MSLLCPFCCEGFAEKDKAVGHVRACECPGDLRFRFDGSVAPFGDPLESLNCELAFVKERARVAPPASRGALELQVVALEKRLTARGKEATLCPFCLVELAPEHPAAASHLVACPQNTRFAPDTALTPGFFNTVVHSDLPSLTPCQATAL